MGSVNYFASGINTITNQANISDGTDGKQIAANGQMNTDAGSLDADVVAYLNAPNSSSMLTVYNALQTYDGDLKADGATSQTIAGVNNYVQELMTLMSSSGGISGAAAGVAAVSNIVGYTNTNGLQSNGKALGYDGAIDATGSALVSTMSAWEASGGTTSGSLATEEAVLQALTAYTNAMSADGASSATIATVTSTVDGEL